MSRLEIREVGVGLSGMPAHPIRTHVNTLTDGFRLQAYA